MQIIYYFLRKKSFHDCKQCIADAASLVGPGFSSITDALSCPPTATLFELIQEIIVTIDDCFSQKLVNCAVVSTAGIFT